MLIPRQREEVSSEIRVKPENFFAATTDWTCLNEKLCYGCESERRSVSVLETNTFEDQRGEVKKWIFVGSQTAEIARERAFSKTKRS
jgi:hypothetical protein